MQTLEIVHRTQYRYARPVKFGEHRALFRPRDSHDLNLLDTALTISPPAQVRWMHDVFSNSIAVAEFGEATAAELLFESRIRLQHFGLDNPDFPVADFASVYPFAYPSDQIPDLGRTIELHYDDPEHRVLDWARGFVAATVPCDTQELLKAINQAIKDDFEYAARDEPGCQSPATTLERHAGSCRDFALLMMEAVRSLGLAARFVTGYLYSPANDPAAPDFKGAGATHAWVQVFLPGAGWVEFDPTNALVGGANLIRVGVARDPSQAVPLEGAYIGAKEDYLGMSVSVTVRTI